jgi:phenylacetate-CoA ligase
MPTASGFARKLYDSLPDRLRDAASWVPFSLRIGPEYRRTLKFLEISDSWSMGKHLAHQEESLKSLLRSAICHVPYYRRRYGRLDLANPWQALAEIEPIEKKTIQDNLKDFRNESIPARHTYQTSTGGTTGRPLEIVLDKVGFQIEWAFMIAQWRRVGFTPGSRRATLRGLALPEGRIVRENPVYDELQLSPFVLNEANIPFFISKINEFQPQFLYGYPSALTILANWIDRHPTNSLSPLKALLCGSENILEGQRAYLERIFQARFYSWYGMSEKVILAGECEHSSHYHAFPQYGITEILDKNGCISTAVGTYGELIGTGFMNRAMPFIRYRTGDFSKIIGQQCEQCGRAFPLLDKVAGRWAQEMVIGKTEARISITALNMHGEAFKGVERFQFHQQEKGRVTLRIVVSNGAANDIQDRILQSLTSKTGNEIDWKIERVGELSLSSRGKAVFLIQELNM